MGGLDGKRSVNDSDSRMEETIVPRLEKIDGIVLGMIVKLRLRKAREKLRDSQCRQSEGQSSLEIEGLYS